jgi:hypothetical protein
MLFGEHKKTDTDDDETDERLREVGKNERVR